MLTKWGYGHSWHLHTPLLTWKHEVQICDITAPHTNWEFNVEQTLTPDDWCLRLQNCHNQQIRETETESPELESSGPRSKEHTYMKGPSWQSEAIRKRRGGSLGFPSVKKSCFPVCPTTKGAMGAAIFSKTGTPRRKGNCSKESQAQSIINKALLPRCAGEMKTLEYVSNTDTRIGSKTHQRFVEKLRNAILTIYQCTCFFPLTPRWGLASVMKLTASRPATLASSWDCWNPGNSWLPPRLSSSSSKMTSSL